MPFIKPYKIPKIDAPLERCYWVVENLLLAGAYPGHPNSHAHTKRISGLWDAGMRTFINLMEEGETNNAGQAFVRYDDVLRELALKNSDRVAHLRFPVPDTKITTVDRALKLETSGAKRAQRRMKNFTQAILPRRLVERKTGSNRARIERKCENKESQMERKRDKNEAQMKRSSANIQFGHHFSFRVWIGENRFFDLPIRTRCRDSCRDWQNPPFWTSDSDAMSGLASGSIDLRNPLVGIHQTQRKASIGFIFYGLPIADLAGKSEFHELL